MEVAFRDYESQPLAADQIRVRSRFGAAKHGSEMAMFQGYAGHRGNYDNSTRLFNQESQMVRYPNGLGNMCVGEVIEVGAGVQDFRLGETVFPTAPSARSTYGKKIASANSLMESPGRQPSASIRPTSPSARFATAISVSAMPWPFSAWAPSAC